MTNTNGFSDKFSSQLRALELAHAWAMRRIPLDAWAFGGGTALALFHFHHRMSHDIDIFVNDPQYFAFLSPKWYADENSDAISDYTELAHHISLTTRDAVKIDLLLSPSLTRDKPVLEQAGRIQCFVEPVSEIIAKKLRHRMMNAHPRDIFDIAAALDYAPEMLKKYIEKKVMAIDELYQWRERLTRLDVKHYRKMIEIVGPEKAFMQIAMEAPSLILEKIADLKSWIRDA